MFHVIDHVGNGGETLLLDGFKAAMDLKSKSPDAFQLLVDTPVYQEYREKSTRIQSLDSVIKLNPLDGHISKIRYNHYDRAPVSSVPQEQIPALYEALGLLTKEIRRPENEHWVKLKPGMVLFVDNWRVMHGRAAFTGRRRVCGCYLPRDDWLSKARVFECL